MLLRAIDERGLRLTSSRCGDFRAALTLLCQSDLFDLGEQMVTHELSTRDMNQAFDIAASPDCIKAVVIQ